MAEDIDRFIDQPRPRAGLEAWASHRVARNRTPRYGLSAFTRLGRAGYGHLVLASVRGGLTACLVPEFPIEQTAITHFEPPAVYVPEDQAVRVKSKRLLFDVTLLAEEWLTPDALGITDPRIIWVGVKYLGMACSFDLPESAQNG